jgi:hypothetical protein
MAAHMIEFVHAAVGGEAISKQRHLSVLCEELLKHC